jgi:hypothetical protein
MEVATKFADAVAALGLDYRVEFVPFSVSRHAKPKPKLSELQLNWRVYVGKAPNIIAADYAQGIGYIPGFRSNWGGMAADEFNGIQDACERGVYKPILHHCRTNKLPPPTQAAVMEALVLDSSSIDYTSYEDWAGDMGYDVDSRKGEAAYRECLSIGLKLRLMLGYANLQELRDAAQEL